MAGGLRVDGVEDWGAALDARLAAVGDATDAGVDAGLQLVQAEAQANLSRASHAAGTPTPSAPGSPPASITGAMGRSFRSRRTRRGPTVYEGRLAPTAPQSRIQELGGTIRPKRGPYLWWHGADGWHRARSVTLPARPYFGPAVRTAAPKVRRLFLDLWTRAIRG